ncbi:MAG: hypothetical protein OEY29_13670 [Gammaproteobacteria bacterium]|nr:hypothetical protein [Gammaproteobacteria bacterium]
MKLSAKSVAIAAGTSFAISLAASSAVLADNNPFGMTKLSGESLQVAGNEGKCGEGKCGGKMESMEKKTEGKCGEGKCGGKMDNKMNEGKCGGDKAIPEGKCGGSNKAESEGKCGGK